MIILSCLKGKSNFKKILNNYINLTNYGSLTCPCCSSSNIIRWGTYERNVIYFESDNKTLTSFVLTIQRVRCKSCGKTHALLPFGIIPYKQFTDEVISQILVELLYCSIEEVSEEHSINPSLIKKWKKQYNKYHKSRISTFLSNHNSKNTLNLFISIKENKINYIDKFKVVFMQIKLGYLSLSPS